MHSLSLGMRLQRLCGLALLSVFVLLATADVDSIGVDARRAWPTKQDLLARQHASLNNLLPRANVEAAANANGRRPPPKPPVKPSSKLSFANPRAKRTFVFCSVSVRTIQGHSLTTNDQSCVQHSLWTASRSPRSTGTWGRVMQASCPSAASRMRLERCVSDNGMYSIQERINDCCSCSSGSSLPAHKAAQMTLSSGRTVDRDAPPSRAFSRKTAYVPDLLSTHHRSPEV